MSPPAPPAPGGRPGRASIGLSWVAVCIVVSGVLVYGYLALIARALPAGEYADFGAYWSIALIIGFGAFLPVELELARLLSSRPAGSPLPAGTRPAVAGLVALSMLTVLTGLPFLLPAVGGLGVVAALLALCLVSAGQFLLRGTLLGGGRLHLHGTVLVGDAALRVATATAVVLLLPDAGPAAFAWTLVTAIALAHLPLLLVLSRRRRPAGAVAGPPAPPRAFLAAIGPLLVGTLCAQVLLNAAPVLVSAVASGTEGALADRFTATFTLVRLPLFVAVPLQSALVPLLTQLSVAGGTGALRRFLLRLTAGIAALTAAGAVLGATLGPPLVRLLFGDRYALPGTATAVLAAGSGVHLGLLVVSQAVLASGRHTQVAVVWAGGLLAGGVVFAVVPDLVFRAALAFALGSAVAMLWGLLVLLRRPAAERSPQPLTPTPGGGSPP